MFTKKDRRSFRYWFAHWSAYQMTALNLKTWKPRFLLHDFEKPWLMKLWKNYNRVQDYHRNHASHHLIHYFKTGKADWLAMVIEWECSRFTKECAQYNAVDEWCKQFDEIEHFLLTYQPSENNTCEWIRHNLSFVSVDILANFAYNAYIQTGKVLKDLGFDVNINVNYLNGIFNHTA